MTAKTNHMAPNSTYNLISFTRTSSSLPNTKSTQDLHVRIPKLQASDAMITLTIH